MLKNILLSISIFIAFLLLIEAVERMDGRYASYQERAGNCQYISPFKVYDKSWYHIVKPYSKRYIKENEFTLSWTANNEGFNDVNFAIPKNKLRIMVLGDSFTEGVGADHDSSFPRQLDYLLRDSFYQTTEVWNCGISGSDLVYEYRLFRDKLLKYNPDMIIILANSSDFNDVMVRGGFERFLPDGSVKYHKSPWFEPLFSVSYIARRIVLGGFKYNWLFQTQDEATKAKIGARHILTDAMDSFSYICSQKKIKLLFAFHPTSSDFQYPMNYEVLPLIDYGKQNNIKVIDIRDELYKMGFDFDCIGPLYWSQDSHCNNIGYRYFAETVWRRVAEDLKMQSQ